MLNISSELYIIIYCSKTILQTLESYSSQCNEDRKWSTSCKSTFSLSQVKFLKPCIFCMMFLSSVRYCWHVEPVLEWQLCSSAVLWQIRLAHANVNFTMRCAHSFVPSPIRVHSFLQLPLVPLVEILPLLTLTTYQWCLCAQESFHFSKSD